VTGALSRRLSEFVGVALFALSLLWLIALASYSASDPVWFFNTGADGPPANFAGRIGAFMAELVPARRLRGVPGPGRPRRDRLALLLVPGARCRLHQDRRRHAALLLRVGLSGAGLRQPRRLGDGVPRRRLPGRVPGGSLAEYLNRTGSIILILTLLFLAIILSTQFSFGRLFQAIGQMLRERWDGFVAALRARREERRREKQRQEVLKKHLDKANRTGAPPVVPSRPARRGWPPPGTAGPARGGGRGATPSLNRRPRRNHRAPPRWWAPPPRRCARPRRSRRRRPPSAGPRRSSAPLPLAPEPERLPVERKKGAYALPPMALLDAPKTERKIDERELMEGRGCSRRSAASSRSRVPSCRSTRGRSSRPTSSSRTPA
jgi:hypothetical protein